MEVSKLISTGWYSFRSILSINRDIITDFGTCMEAIVDLLFSNGFYFTEDSLLSFYVTFCVYLKIT